MKSINLFEFTQLPNEVDEEIVKEYHKNLSKIDGVVNIRLYEYIGLKNFVANLTKKVSYDDLSYFYYNFSIPQISKEFDLLKIGNYIINVELKSTYTTSDDITYQLRQNLYYLKHFSKIIHSFVYIQDTNSLLTFIDNDLKPIDFEYFIKINNEITDSYDCHLEKMFRVSNFLVSPLNSPAKFIKQDYFLTGQQQYFKKKIIDQINNCSSMFAIEGKAGTGKTLLLYDIGLELSHNAKVVIIHSGILCTGHYKIDKMTNIDIYPIKKVGKIKIDNYDVILLDEAQRIWKNSFDILIKSINFDKQSVIFSLDPAQYLSIFELESDSSNRIKSLPKIEILNLSVKIRTNKEIATFVSALEFLNKSDRVTSNKNIDVVYADNYKIADLIIKEYTKKGYKFINYTPSAFGTIRQWGTFIKTDNSHEVIGQEFDNVVVSMGQQFKYNEQNKLVSKKHPYGQYLYNQLLFQQLTRVRNKLCIVVYDNIDLHRRILSIFN